MYSDGTPTGPPAASATSTPEVTGTATPTSIATAPATEAATATATQPPAPTATATDALPTETPTPLPTETSTSASTATVTAEPTATATEVSNSAQGLGVMAMLVPVNPRTPLTSDSQQSTITINYAGVYTEPCPDPERSVRRGRNCKVIPSIS